jgi:hypothetical protein
MSSARLLLPIDGSAGDPVDAWRIVRGELDSWRGARRQVGSDRADQSDLLDEKKRAKILKALEKLVPSSLSVLRLGKAWTRWLMP